MNSSSSNDLIPFQCLDPTDPGLDIVLYIFCFFYYSIGLFLHGSILRMIFFTDRTTLKDNSFFQIYAMDSIMVGVSGQTFNVCSPFQSIFLISVELFFNRLFLFISPFCPIVGPFFWDTSIIMKLVYLILHHSRFSKSVAQIIMVLNRMSCVLAPSNYDRLWRIFTPVSRVLVVILPFGGTWNLIISRVFGQSIRGGFSINYKRAVQWVSAALSMFQSIYISTALFFTIICTSITVYKLYILPDRIKTAERALCITSFFTSLTFLFVAGTQLTFLYCTTCNRDFLFIFQSFAFDTFTVGSAVILIASNKNLRTSLFSKKDDGSKRIVTVTPISK
ncbi:hypothetical protein CRE_06692 [Caenorhabditis remanei]|uniref:Serpentine receptor class gamma n=1 Tax=Caenorhabditis remanei TaxID=31234 RepID=E3M0Z9_CAERE|nr:hypothetical protein CRE_06692 [Caenorhabditis remanei]